MAEPVELDGDTHGGQQKLSELRRARASAAQIAKVEAALARLEDLVKPALKAYPHTPLAHAGVSEFKQALPPLDEAIRAAVDLVDAIAGTRNSYKSLDVDLRHEVLGEPSEA